jgi:hypothetical protein
MVGRGSAVLLAGSLRTVLLAPLARSLRTVFGRLADNVVTCPSI